MCASPSGFRSNVVVGKVVPGLGVNWANEASQVRPVSLALTVMVALSHFIDRSCFFVSLVRPIQLVLELQEEA